MSSLQEDLNLFRIQPARSSSGNVSPPIGAASNGEPPPEADASTVPELDLQALAQKVYDLLKQEARIERDRLGRVG